MRPALSRLWGCYACMIVSEQWRVGPPGQLSMNPTQHRSHSDMQHCNPFECITLNFC